MFVHMKIVSKMINIKHWLLRKKDKIKKILNSK